MKKKPRGVLAFDLGGTKLSAAMVSERGKILARIDERVEATSLTATIGQFVRLGKELSRNYRPSSCGVAVPGLVRRDGTVWAPNLPGWKRVPLENILRRKLGVPVKVESDRNAAVLGEVWRGEAQGKTDVVVVMVGTGIGAGILSGGRLVRGTNELSGCAGWMAFTPRTTKAGLRIGELESLAAGPGIARAAGCRSAEEAARKARSGNRRARTAFQNAGRMLGLAAANLISLFDPEVVVLSGGMMGAANLFLPELRRTALRHCQPISGKQVELCISSLGAEANLLGAAYAALERQTTQ